MTLGVVAATVLGAQAPTHEIEQIYYIGAFDPLGQHEAQMYRIRVHGQASFISQVDFASGWVRAELIDSLGTTLRFEGGDSGESVIVKNSDDKELARIGGGRKLFQFGPEGVRKVPKDHRLVIVMGSSPQNFFSAVDSALGTVAKTLAEQQNGQLTRELFEALVQIEAESRSLQEVQKDLVFELKGE